MCGAGDAGGDAGRKAAAGAAARGGGAAASAAELCKAASKFLDAGDPRKAAQCFKEVLAQSQDSYQATLGMGDCLLELGRYRRAFKWYRRAAKRRDSARARTGMGIALLKVKKFGSAIMEFNRATAADPHYMKAKIGRATALASAGRTDRAVDEYNKIIRSGRANSKAVAHALCEAGNALLDGGDTREASRFFIGAIKNDGKLFAAHAGLGAAYYIAGQLSEARNRYALASSLDPRNPVPYVNIALIHLRQGRANDAIAYADKALEANPKYAFAYSVKARALDKKGYVFDSMACIREAMRIDRRYAKDPLGKSEASHFR